MFLKKSVFKSSATRIIFFFIWRLLCISSKAAPIHIKEDCNNGVLFQPNSRFEANLDVLLSNLTSSVSFYSGFNRAIVADGTPDTVSGLFFCNSGAIPTECQDCVSTAAKDIRRLCPNKTESIIWYDMCLLRYSNESFKDVVPLVSLWGNNNMDNAEQDLLDKVLTDTLNTLVAIANSPRGNNKTATQELDLTWSKKTLSSRVLCLPDLSTSQCNQCLQNTIVFFPTCCRGAMNTSIVLPRCNVNYKLLSYNTAVAPPQPVVSPPLSGNHLNGQLKRIIVIVVPTVGSGIFFCLVCCLLWKRKRKNYKAVLRENFGIESTALESLQFNLATIEAATNNFSQKNRIGKGGFGEVYKGILSDGREIAIKRLSKNSGQGDVEFKNEILLIAKLQHRNLVTLLGFCLEEQEKMLIYEYVPNKSLDYLLSGTQKRSVLDWPERYKIIEGIAQGILYLHKYSRLKIIHRDLKPSNILLDNNMNPKISDFGMAKMVGIDDIQGSTNRVVGTFDYMSPEYIMFGQFSEKSDIFSFGVIVLEIISGKKNATVYESQYVNGLLDYAWKLWREQNLMEILDSSVTEVGSHSEVIKCIHIGLLCVQENADARPSITTVVSYLNNESIKLPYPKEPAFFMHGRTRQQICGANESGSGQPSSSAPCSVTEMSMSDFLPR